MRAGATQAALSGANRPRIVAGMVRQLQAWGIIALLALGGCTGVRIGGPPPSGAPRIASGQYVVQRGDTVYRVATQFGVPMRTFIEFNRLDPPYTLFVGQVLTIPPAPTHLVRRGETVYRIAQMHDVDMSALVRVNNLEPPYVIHIGQVLQLPGTTEPKEDPGVAALPTSSGAPSIAPPAIAAPEPRSQALATPEAAAEPQVAAAPPPKAAAIPTPPPRQGRGLEWPVKGQVVVPYGSVAKGMRNDGINISAKLGTSVRAAEAGVVAYAGNELKGFGNMLLIKHSDGLITTYAHADEIKVQRGATVKRGQIIASVGQTGAVTSPQLHFEVRQGAKAVDPMQYLN
jgi:murein DD-endopeptidase MepM/ murein hydrolase activator NlpD